MVVGGYAIAFHGYVRGTGDIDLWIRIPRTILNESGMRCRTLVLRYLI